MDDITSSRKTRRVEGITPPGSLSDAKKLQSEKIAELQRHREGRFNLDDREMLSQARDLASSHGYTVLQAVQEWHSSKGSSKATPLGEEASGEVPALQHPVDSSADRRALTNAISFSQRWPAC